MRKIVKLFIFGLLLCSFYINTEARTLQDLKNELVLLEKEKKEAEDRKKLTQTEINRVSERMNNISALIAESELKIKDLSSEIVVLEEKAALKEVEIKDVISFLQVTNSENAYMEYIFGANSMEDLILRSAVSEQLVAYNNDLIEDYNETVKAHRLKTEELNQEVTNLSNEQNNLKVELIKLGDSFESIVDISVDINSEIDAQRKVIKHYESLGCSDTQDISTCGSIPFAGKMVRPISSGRISSVYGMRKHPVDGVYKLHSGTDLIGSTDIYAVAPGTVSHIFWKERNGGTKLFIHHNINGTYYTSAYYHLYKVLVEPGDYVDQNTKIAIMGGSAALTPWDKSTTGRHLHLSISRGLYKRDYYDYGTFVSRTIDPTSVINFPAKGVWFRNRTSVY